MTKRRSGKQTGKAGTSRVPGAKKRASYKIRTMDTYFVFKILPADTPEDQRLLGQLAGACRKAAFLFKKYRQSVAQRARTLDPLLLENAWGGSGDVEDGSRPQMTTELSEMGHVSPAELFGSMIMKRLPGGYDPRDLRRFTFDGFMEEMAAGCERFAKPGKRRSRQWSLRWLIAYCHDHLWGNEGLGVYLNGDRYSGPFLDLMERILRQIGYEYHSRDALGQTCVKVLRKQKRYREKGLDLLRTETSAKDVERQ